MGIHVCKGIQTTWEKEQWLFHDSIKNIFDSITENCITNVLSNFLN